MMMQYAKDLLPEIIFYGVVSGFIKLLYEQYCHNYCVNVLQVGA